MGGGSIRYDRGSAGKTLADNGFKEIILTGNTCGFIRKRFRGNFFT